MLEISDVPSKHIFKIQKREAAEEVKEREPKEENVMQLEVKQVCLSLIRRRTEVLTFVLDNFAMETIYRKANSESIFYANLDRLQIDN